jgi:hypothetical protein
MVHDLGLAYDNMFAWLMRWSTEGLIVQVDAFLDSALVQQIITENESGVYKYTDQRKTLRVGPMGQNCTNT